MTLLRKRQHIIPIVLAMLPVVAGCGKSGPEDEPEGPSYPTDLPTIVISTVGYAPINSKDTYVKGYIQVLDPLKQCSSVEEYNGTLNIRGRGTTTWTAEKKSYRIKLDEAAELLGLDDNKDWYLLSEYYDKSLIRNQVGMELSRICGMDWTPAMQSVELYVNGAYLGVYTLSEAREISKKKVNIGTEDFYMELEENMDKPVCFWSDHLLPVTFYKPENPNSTQRDYVIRRFSDFEKVLYSDDFSDPADGYASMLDVDSAANYYIIEELSKNIDGNMRKSTFLTLGPERPIQFYHVWDFDRAFGNCYYMDQEYPGATNTYEGWFIRNQTLKHNEGWYERLFADPEFVKRLQTRWDELYPRLMKVDGFIYDLAESMDGAQQRNFERWDILNRSYDSYIQSLRTFYSQRLDWLNYAIHNPDIN